MRNDLVRHAIQRLNITPDNATRNELYSHLSQGFLLVAVGEVPDEIDRNGTVLPEDTALTILTTTMPDGGSAILVFTDIESLQAYASGTSHVVMRSRDVLEVVVDQHFDALILNASGPWAGVPREDVLRILEGVWSEKRS
jgi:hypothetical protein